MEAITMFDHALSINPKDAKIYHNKGYYFFSKLREYTSFDGKIS